ncbi:MAG TPA: 50S ribosomal protein L4 [Candidatus Baltobacteraceae bacterium]|jgi:large subunit ribosomal protein L4|nr:50S ribosomal protein L4 [Candidatus Baltobacteraceae bacterium]
MPNVIDATGKVLREEQTPEIFAQDYSDKAHAIYRAVHRELANPRAGTASTKKRDEVSGGGRKPWRQKGTGRARQGSIRSPQWTHGGVVFGPQPRSYATDLNKKERRVAFIAALADRFRDGAVTVLDAGDFAIEKTGQFAALLFGSTKDAKTGPATLVVFGRDERAGEKLERVSRNLAKVGTTHTGALDVKDVLRYNRIVFTSEAYAQLVNSFSNNGDNR